MRRRWLGGAGAACAATAVLVAQSAPPQQPPAFRGLGSAVPIYATVTDASHRPVAGLSRADFEIFDEGRRREITVFAAGPHPITAVLLLDMNGPAIDVPWVRAAADAFVDALTPGDRVRIGTFGNEVALSPQLTGDASYLHWMLREELWPSWASPLWNAIDAGLSSLPRDAEQLAAVVLSNGYDRPRANQLRKHNANDVLRTAESLGAVVHVVTFEDTELDGGLRTLANRTGGRLDRVADLSGAAPVLAGIVDELHTQYLLGFVPDTLDGETHALDVRIRRPGLEVRARARYVAAVRR